MRLRDLLGPDAAIAPQAEAVDVNGLAVDSRAVKPGDLFFALAGSKTDGSRPRPSALPPSQGEQSLPAASVPAELPDRGGL